MENLCRSGTSVETQAGPTGSAEVHHNGKDKKNKTGIPELNKYIFHLFRCRDELLLSVSHMSVSSAEEKYLL